jgi:ribosomal protein S18 acetylase RimI-like enzyme
VLPEARGTGVGHALVSQVIASAAQAGAARLTLLVDQDNLPARRLYDRLGFRERARMLFASRRARNRAAA